MLSVDLCKKEASHGMISLFLKVGVVNMRYVEDSHYITSSFQYKRAFINRTTNF